MKYVLTLLGGFAAILAAAGWASVMFGRFDVDKSTLTAHLGLQAAAVLLAAWGVIRQLEANRESAAADQRRRLRERAFDRVLSKALELKNGILDVCEYARQHAEWVQGSSEHHMGREWEQAVRAVRHAKRDLFDRMIAATRATPEYTRSPEWFEQFDNGSSRANRSS